jgi:hypothetical protein
VHSVASPADGGGDGDSGWGRTVPASTTTATATTVATAAIAATVPATPDDSGWGGSAG